MELMQANRQWASRPADERFLCLEGMLAHFELVRRNSREIVVSNRAIEAHAPDKDTLFLAVGGQQVGPTHWSFGQLAGLGAAPAGYLRTLPAQIAALNLNYGLNFARGGSASDVGTLLTRVGDSVQLRAATGPKYGRVWNHDIIKGLIDRFGNGVDGKFRVPGEWGQKVAVTKENTTLYASDEDCFVFLCDEENRIENPHRRDGKSGTMARGFFVWNSEVGAQTLGVATFLFDYVCGNRIVWGADGFREIRIRHTASAPDRWAEELAPALTAYANSSTAGIDEALAAAKSKTLGDKLDDFLAKNFGAKVGEKMKLAHLSEELRPMETPWDVITGATAFAKSIPNQNDRVAIERKAGDIFGMFAPKQRVSLEISADYAVVA